jgi:hypothetical protein
MEHLVASGDVIPTGRWNAISIQCIEARGVASILQFTGKPPQQRIMGLKMSIAAKLA